MSSFYICTPTPIGLCYDIKSKDISFYARLIGFNYSYDFGNTTEKCSVTQTINNTVITCSDVTTTISNPILHFDDIQKQMNKLNDDITHIKNTFNIANGVSAGGVPTDTTLKKRMNINMFNMLNHNNTQLDKKNIANDMIKLNVCSTCGTELDLEYIKKNKLIWCQVCSISHVFTPMNILIFDFKTDDEINNYKNDLLALYDQGKDYWIN